MCKIHTLIYILKNNQIERASLICTVAYVSFFHLMCNRIFTRHSPVFTYFILIYRREVPPYFPIPHNWHADCSWCFWLRGRVLHRISVCTASLGLFLTFWMALSFAGFACVRCHVDLEVWGLRGCRRWASPELAWNSGAEDPGLRARRMGPSTHRPAWCRRHPWTRAQPSLSAAQCHHFPLPWHTTEGSWVVCFISS